MLPLEDGHNKKIKIHKSVSENMNFYIPNGESHYYDLRYDFQINVFKGALAYSDKSCN